MNEPDNVDADPRPGAPIRRFGFGPYLALEPGQAAPHLEGLWEMAFAGRVPMRRGVGRWFARCALRLPKSVRDPLILLAAGIVKRSPTLPRNIVVKSVLAHFAIDWIAERFDPQVVVIQRDPLNVVSSWLRLNVHGYDLHTRQDLRESHFAPLGIPAPPANGGRAALTAWWVGTLNTVLAQALDRHPEWTFITHEVLCANAVDEFQSLYRRLGLTWTDEAERFLVESGYHRPTFRRSDWEGAGLTGEQVTKAQPNRWKERLSAEEVEEIRAVLDDFPNRGWVKYPVTSIEPTGQQAQKGEVTVK
jgi:hypothetical protein